MLNPLNDNSSISPACLTSILHWFYEFGYSRYLTAMVWMSLFKVMLRFNPQYEVLKWKLNTLTVIFFFFLRYWDLNSRPIPWATPPALFRDGFFGDRVSRTICPCWLLTAVLLISASWVAKIIALASSARQLWWFEVEPLESKVKCGHKCGARP
jgi:hypothetical protein